MIVARALLPSFARAAALLALLAPTAAGCGDPAAAKQNGKPRGGGAANAKAPRPVKLAPVTRQKLGRSVVVSGTLAADEQVLVGSRSRAGSPRSRSISARS